MKIVLLCREVDRDTGKIAVYSVGKVPGDREPLLFELSLRQVLNPELRYFAVLDRELRRLRKLQGGTITCSSRTKDRR